MLVEEDGQMLAPKQFSLSIKPGIKNYEKYISFYKSLPVSFKDSFNETIKWEALRHLVRFYKKKGLRPVHIE
jgi:hypothetical protein